MKKETPILSISHMFDFIVAIYCKLFSLGFFVSCFDYQYCCHCNIPFKFQKTTHESSENNLSHPSLKFVTIPSVLLTETKGF